MRTACYPACALNPRDAFPPGELGDAQYRKYTEGYMAVGNVLLAANAVVSVASRLLVRLGARAVAEATAARTGLFGTLAARLRQLAGFADRGTPVILDENIAGRGVAEALRARGFNVRDVFEIYGRGGVSDAQISQLAESIGGRVLTQNVRDFSAAVRIGVDARVGTHVDTLARVLSDAL